MTIFIFQHFSRFTLVAHFRTASNRPPSGIASRALGSFFSLAEVRYDAEANPLALQLEAPPLSNLPSIERADLAFSPGKKN